MIKKILISSLALGTLALGAPVAQADTPTFGCTFRAVQQDDATGQNFEGAAFGYLVHSQDATATIRCYISVNDPTGTNPPGGQSSTPWSTPNPSGVSATSGRLTYFAGDTDVVTFHAEYCTSHNCTVHTYQTTRIQIPPQEVIDLLISVFETIDAALAPVWDALTQIEKDYVDPVVCPILASRAGDYAPLPIVINAQGDVFIDGEPFWDCPPYDLFG